MAADYIISFILFGSLLLVMLAGIIIAFMVIHKQRIKQYKMKLNETAYSYQNELLRTRIEVQEQAFNRISREIHDNVGQVLSITRMKLHHARNNEMYEGMKQAMLEAGEAISKSVKDLRNLSHILNGKMIEKLDLTEAIEKELSYIRSLHRLTCTFSYSPALPSTNNEQNLLLFRIIQEALHNIVKHAAATEIDITLIYEDEALQLRIFDNGKGFDPEKADTGLGLINIRQRTELLQGQLSIRSAPEIGTYMIITIKSIHHEKSTD